MPTAYVNRYGRKWGRGVRPWLLIPKFLCVCTLLGGMIAVVVTIQTARLTSPSHGHALIRTLSTLYRFVIVPGAVGSIVFGVLLLLAAGPRIMLRQRWLQAKLGLAVATILTLHLTCRWLLMQTRDALATIDPDAYLEPLGRLQQVTLVGTGLFVVIIVMGRLKPRLGQNWARAYPRNSG